MSVLKLPPMSQLFTNYCGGIGYYALHFAWVLLAFTTLLRVMQYVVLQNQPVVYSPVQTSPIANYEAAVPAIVSFAVAAILLVVTVTSVLLLPYWLGYISRVIPRWLLRQTSWKITTQTIYVTKQILVSLIFVAAVLSSYQPAMDAAANVTFFVMTIACMIASLAFVLQHTLITLWKIPERRIY